MQLLKYYILAIAMLMMFQINSSAQIALISNEHNDTNIDSLAVDSTSTTTLDSVDISILTCTPGKDLYSKFGHTALRVINYTKGGDFVFNYGCFNYNSENFVVKFLLGQTNYLLEEEPTDYFFFRYNKMGNGVTEQLLNLTNVEKQKLIALLLENLRPENQEYRYKWIGDNCTDRARGIVEEAINGNVEYPFNVDSYEPTVRESLHQCLEQVPWVSFGIDMILGSEIDYKYNPQDSISQDYGHRLNMFIPATFMINAEQAVIVKNGKRIPYVCETKKLLNETFTEDAPSVFTPTVVFGVLLLIVILISAIDLRRTHSTIWVDITLSTIQGVAGILISFLFFFSEHPAVGSNWLVIIFNPLAILYASWIAICRKKQKKNKFAVVNMTVLAAFLLTMWLCPQSFNVAIYLLELTLLVRSVTYFILEKRVR
ncbi:MAG: DUF4105 domain-containing protein [Prevotellaceae bacterium]|nr:DUF4105 domain-containing protein [Candidatus Minthosoma caballi]